MRSSSLRGIVAMLAAVATFSVMDVALKTLVAAYPSMQVTFLRGASSLPFLLGATAVFGRWRDLIPRRWQLHVFRGFLSIGTLSCFIYALDQLSLANTYAVFMSAPLLITALSVPMLGEHVGWRRWIAVLVGLIGVIVVLKPTGVGMITLGGLAALASAVMYAIGAITIRILSRTDSGAPTVFWALFITTIVTGLIAAPNWVPLKPAHWAWITGLGLSGAVGQYLFTQAFRLTAPSSLAPLEYTALMWGIMFDWLLWATAPGARMLCGAAIIVSSGLYVIYRERLKHSAGAATTPASEPVVTPDAPS